MLAAFCFSGSLLRANFSIVSLFFLFDGVIVRGKYSFLSFFISWQVVGLGLENRTQSGWTYQAAGWPKEVNGVRRRKNYNRIQTAGRGWG